MARSGVISAMNGGRVPEHVRRDRVAQMRGGDVRVMRVDAVRGHLSLALVQARPQGRAELGAPHSIRWTCGGRTRARRRARRGNRTPAPCLPFISEASKATRGGAPHNQVLADLHGGEVGDAQRAERQERDHEAVAVVHGVETRVVRSARLPLGHQLLAELQQGDRRHETACLLRTGWASGVRRLIARLSKLRSAPGSITARRTRDGAAGSAR